MSPERPIYWQEARLHLKKDPVMGQLVERFPAAGLESRGDAFYTLSRSIVGQQISVKAADAVWGRFAGLLPEFHAHAVLGLEETALRTCGLSRQKIAYLRYLSEFFLEQGITSHLHWDGMEDEAVIRHLTQVKGIGRWSAEMFLMFCLMRPDVYPLDDIGLQRGLGRHYGLAQKPFSRQLALEVAEPWRPYRSVATWYLWRSIDPGEVQY